MPSTQRARSGVPLDQRSAVPSVPGIPAWGAVAIAVGAAFAGVVLDALRGTELTLTFAGLYVLGCLAAVLAVRSRGLFTAMAQPPLVLFVGVPLAYYFLTDEAGGTTIKDFVLNAAIPLVNRFPLMLGTSIAVLAIGLARMILASGQRHTPKATRTASERTDARDRTGSRKRPDPRERATRAVRPDSRSGAAASDRDGAGRRQRTRDERRQPRDERAANGGDRDLRSRDERTRSQPARPDRRPSDRYQPDRRQPDRRQSDRYDGREAAPFEGSAWSSPDRDRTPTADRTTAGGNGGRANHRASAPSRRAATAAPASSYSAASAVVDERRGADDFVSADADYPGEPYRAGYEPRRTGADNPALQRHSAPQVRYRDRR